MSRDKGLPVSKEVRQELKGKVSAGYKRGARLDELLDFLTTLQAHGVPPDADIHINEGECFARWREMQ